MALRLNGISHWVMWEMAALFEHIGTVQDGINTLSRPHAVRRPRRTRKPLRRDARRDPLRARELRATAASSKRDRRPDRCTSGPARRSAWSAARARARSTIVNLLLRFYDVEHGRILIDGQDIAQRHAGQPARADRHGDAGHLAAAPLGARQHPLRPARRDRRADGRRGASAPRRTSSSQGSSTRRAGTPTTRTSASAASSCPAASASASRSRA